MLQNMSISNKSCSFEISNHQMFLEHKINIYEGFVKYHVKLKTGVIPGEKNKINKILKYRNQ